MRPNSTRAHSPQAHSSDVNGETNSPTTKSRHKMGHGARHSPISNHLDDMIPPWILKEIPDTMRTVFQS